MIATRTVPTITGGMLACWLLFATVPLWIERVGLYQYLGVEILIFATYALAYNLVLGHAGLPSFGHGAFFGIGAYAFGLAQFNIAANLWICLCAAALAAAIAGVLVAAFISHRRGIYYSLMTIAFGQVFWFIAVKAHSITGGEDGLLKIKRLPVEFGFASIDITDTVALYYVVLAAFMGVSLLLWRLVHSPFGRIVKAIKQNETRARFVGYDVWRYKAAVLVLSAALSGLAGGFFAMAQASAFPDVMSLHYSGYVVMMTLVGGGLVSFWGPVIGAVAFFLTRDIIGSLTTGWMLWFGLSFVAMVMFKPEGIAGMFATSPERLRARVRAPAPAVAISAKET
jgi:branched-chain amino acid transport system permease protein